MEDILRTELNKGGANGCVSRIRHRIMGDPTLREIIEDVYIDFVDGTPDASINIMIKKYSNSKGVSILDISGTIKYIQ